MRDHLVSILQIGHILVFVCVILFGWGAYRVASFRNKNAQLSVYIGLFIVGMLILSLLVHKLCNVKTKLGYVLGMNSYPKYELY